MKFAATALAFVGALLNGVGASDVYKLKWVGDYVAGDAWDTDAAEHIAWNPDTKQMFVASADSASVKVVDVTDPTKPTKVRSLTVKNDLSTCSSGSFDTDSVQSIAVVEVSGYTDRVVVAAAPSSDELLDGMLAFYNAKTFEFLACKPAGNKPEGIASKNGHVSCINEGSPKDYPTSLAETNKGSITMCSISGSGPTISCSTKEFTSANFATGEFVDADTFRTNGVRLFGPYGDNVDYDIEPEGGCFTEDGLYEFVVLQDNNAYAMYDVAAGKYLFMKGFVPEATTFDPSDKDNAVDIRSTFGSTSVKSLIMPDQVTCFTHGSTYYFLTADEGDTRDKKSSMGESGDFEGEEVRMGDVCTATACADETQLGRILTSTFMPGDFAQQVCGDQVTANSGADTCTATYIDTNKGSTTYGTTFGTNVNGVTGGAYSIGGRTISLFSWDGSANSVTKVWDSGTDFEKYTSGSGGGWKISEADLCAACISTPSSSNCANCPFNTHSQPPDFEERSDAKGPEPECVETGIMPDGTRLAFAGLERTGGIATYDMTNPSGPVFQDLLNVRNWRTGSEDATTYGDWSYWLNDGPEDLHFIPEDESPIGVPMLAAATPLAGRLSMYVIEKGASRGGDGSCSSTVTCPYIASSLGGEGSAIVDYCDIASTAFKKSYGCKVGSDDDDQKVAIAVGLSVAGVMVLLSLVCGYYSYRRGHDSGYALAKDFDAKQANNDI